MNVHVSVIIVASLHQVIDLVCELSDVTMSLHVYELRRFIPLLGLFIY